MTKRRKARSLEFEDTLVVRLPTRKPRKERYLSVPPSVRSALRPGRGGRHLGVGKFVRSGSRLNQRVVFKARFCRGSGGAKTIDALFKHVRYLMRDGVGEGGKEARVSLNGSTIERPDSRHTIADWADDRHHFRFILSPEKGKELDLESFGNDFMSQVQRDLQTKLTYFTVCHYNTDNPHVHIVLRGKKDDGADLVISRDYISRGMRMRAEELATRRLGYRSVSDVMASVERDLVAERPTVWDRDVEVALKESGRRVYRSSDDKESRKVTQTAKRLTFLVGLGFAKEVAPHQFLVQERFLSDLRETLRSPRYYQVVEPRRGASARHGGWPTCAQARGFEDGRVR